MVLTSRAIRDEVATLLDYLIDSNIALFTSTVAMSPRLVSWHAASPAPLLTPGRRRSIALSDYLYWLDSGHYSAVLSDGALLQITYEIDGGAIERHRLAYVPCPFELDVELLETEPIGDLVREYARRPRTDEVLLLGAVRFDFDVDAAKPGHPAAHLTFNSTDCRIACSAPVRVGNFADFVFRNFYSEVWKAHPYFARMPRTNWGAKTLTDEEAQFMHVAWSA